MVKPTLEEIRASDLTPLERELALASFGAEALADEPVAVTPAGTPAAASAAEPATTPAAAAVAAIEAALRDPEHAHPATGAPASRDSVASGAASAAVSHPPYDPALDSNPHMQAWRGRLDALRARNAIAKPLRACGRLTRAAGLVLEAVGLRLSVGAEVMIELPPGSSLPMAEAEVVGFSGDKLFLMPTTEVIGLLPGARVYPLESAPIADPMAGAKRLPVGW
jgi:flagellum-specific ATP synthase